MRATAQFELRLCLRCGSHFVSEDGYFVIVQDDPYHEATDEYCSEACGQAVLREVGR